MEENNTTEIKQKNFFKRNLDYIITMSILAVIIIFLYVSFSIDNNNFKNETIIENYGTFNLVLRAVDEKLNNISSFDYELYEYQDLISSGNVKNNVKINLPKRSATYDIVTQSIEYYNSHGTLIIGNVENLGNDTEIEKVILFIKKGVLSMAHEGGLKKGVNEINLTIKTDGLFQDGFLCYSTNENINITTQYTYTRNRPKMISDLDNLECFIILDKMYNNKVRLTFKTNSNEINRDDKISIYLFDHEWTPDINGTWDYTYEKVSNLENGNILISDVGSKIYQYSIKA